RGALATWHGVSLSRAAGESAVTKAARELAEVQSTQFAVNAGTNVMSKRQVLVLMLLLLSSAAVADDFVGQASVIDGDTLEIHGMRIRLWGIDAPESSQLCRGEDSLQYRCGAKAANDLDTFIARRPVNCLPITLDQYGRTVASCSVDDVDLGQWLVRGGLAQDWPQYSKGKYE